MKARVMIILAFAITTSCIGAPTSTAHEEQPIQGAAPAATEICAGHIARYREVIADPGAGGCHSDTDCAVYGGLDPDAVCGGVTDADTARRLRAIGEASDAAGCPRPGYSCSALEPRCLNGTCQNSDESDAAASL